MTWNELCTMHSGLVHFQNWNWWSSKFAWCLTFEDSVLKVEKNNVNVGFGNTGRHFQDHDKFFMIPFEDKIQQGCEIIFYVTSTIIITLRNLQFLQTSVQKHTHFGNWVTWVHKAFSLKKTRKHHNQQLFHFTSYVQAGM